MPKQLSKATATINYTFSCGLIKNTKGREDRQLKAFYKLHQKKCDKCRSTKFNDDKFNDCEPTVIIEKTKQDMSKIGKMFNNKTIINFNDLIASINQLQYK